MVLTITSNDVIIFISVDLEEHIMNDIIKELWGIYADKCADTTPEEKQYVARLCELYDILIKTIPQDKISVFEDFSESNNELGAIFAEKAFFCGVKFATEYLIRIFSHI